MNIREEQKGREGERERERGVCFVTVGGAGQRERATETKSGLQYKQFLNLKLKNIKKEYIYAKENGKIKKQPTILVIERNMVTY